MTICLLCASFSGFAVWQNYKLHIASALHKYSLAGRKWFVWSREVTHG